jgi:hypothetical protein
MTLKSKSPLVQDHTDGDFECTMDGYVGIVTKLIKSFLFVPSIIKEAYILLLPDDLAKAVDLTYDGVLSIFAFPGYAIAVFYYLGLEYGFAEPICSVMTSVAVPINAVYGCIDFADVDGNYVVVESYSTD